MKPADGEVGQPRFVGDRQHIPRERTHRGEPRRSEHRTASLVGVRVEKIDGAESLRVLHGPPYQREHRKEGPVGLRHHPIDQVPAHHLSRSELEPVEEAAHMHDETAVAVAPEPAPRPRSEDTSELQSRQYLVCRLLLDKKKSWTCCAKRSSSATVPSARYE